MATTNRYLVTGARGQDGLILISKLAAQGHEVLGVVRKQADADFVKLYEPKAKVICLDLLDKDAVTKMLEEYSPTHRILIDTPSRDSRCASTPRIFGRLQRTSPLGTSSHLSS